MDRTALSNHPDDVAQRARIMDQLQQATAQATAQAQQARMGSSERAGAQAEANWANRRMKNVQENMGSTSAYGGISAAQTLYNMGYREQPRPDSFMANDGSSLEQKMAMANGGTVRRKRGSRGGRSRARGFAPKTGGSDYTDTPKGAAGAAAPQPQQQAAPLRIPDTPLSMMGPADLSSEELPTMRLQEFADGGPVPWIGDYKPGNPAAWEIGYKTANLGSPVGPGATAFDNRSLEQKMQKTRAMGLAEGGMIRGPGTGTSDSIETAKDEGTFIMPADSTEALGQQALGKLAKVPVRLSNGEFEFTPEQTHNIGAAVLTALKDATHTPVDAGSSSAKAPKARGFALGGMVPFGSVGSVARAGSRDIERQSAANMDQARQAEDLRKSGAIFNARLSRDAALDDMTFRQMEQQQNDQRRYASRPIEAGWAAEERAAAENMRRQGAIFDDFLAGKGNPMNMFANGGLVQRPRGFFAEHKAGLNEYADGGTVSTAGMYYADGRELGSSGQFVKVPEGIGHQPGRQSDVVQTAEPSRTQQPTQAAQPAQAAPPPAPAYTGDAGRGKVNPPAAEPARELPEWSRDQMPYREQMRNLGSALLQAPVTAAKHLVSAPGYGFNSDMKRPAPAAPAPQTAPGNPAPPVQEASSPNPTDQRLAAGTQAAPRSRGEQAGQHFDRTGMTNAQVAEANPQGQVRVSRQPNGTMSFSGEDVRGAVSYTDEQGNALPGGGPRGRGFARVDSAPAGSTVAMDGEGNYAFATSGSGMRSGPMQTAAAQQPAYGSRGFVPALPAGMTGEQMAQYAREVEAARTNARGAQIAEDMRGNKALRDWNDLRSPVSVARHNADVTLTSLFASPEAKQVAGQTINKLAAMQFAQAGNEGIIAENTRRYDDQAGVRERAYGDAREQVDYDRNRQAVADRDDYRAKDVQLEAAQRMGRLQGAYMAESNPEKKAMYARELAALQGKGQPEQQPRWKTSVVPGGTDEQGNRLPGYAVMTDEMTGESRVINPGAAGQALPAPPAKSQRVVGHVYQTSKGPMRWTDQGFTDA